MGTDLARRPGIPAIPGLKGREQETMVLFKFSENVKDVFHDWYKLKDDKVRKTEDHMIWSCNCCLRCIWNVVLFKAL